MKAIPDFPPEPQHTPTVIVEWYGNWLHVFHSPEVDTDGWLGRVELISAMAGRGGVKHFLSVSSLPYPVTTTWARGIAYEWIVRMQVAEVADMNIRWHRNNEGVYRARIGPVRMAISDASDREFRASVSLESDPYSIGMSFDTLDTAMTMCDGLAWERLFRFYLLSDDDQNVPYLLRSKRPPPTSDWDALEL
jgi:hypothetical protein